MVKKFYFGLVSLKYVYFMFGLPLVIFTLAFLETRKKVAVLKYGMMGCAFLLAIVLIFYYRDKFRVSKALKQVKDLQEYARGGVVDRSWILEDRILCCHDFDIHEIQTNHISKLCVVDTLKEKVILQLTSEGVNYLMSALNQKEAERFASYVKRKNHNVLLENIEPSGNGTLQELGAGIQV